MLLAMQSLIATMGVLLAHYDERRDFLSNFEPFIDDRLATWPPAEPVGSREMSQALTEAFNFPPIPLNTVSELLRRAGKAGRLKRGHNRKQYPNPQNLRDVNGDLTGQRTETLAHFEAVAVALRDYAKHQFSLDWSSEQADAALEGFVSEFGIEMAEARYRGTLEGELPKTKGIDIAVVHGFARHCLKQDAVNFGYLEELVRGSILTSVLYFKDLGTWSPHFQNLVAYLDTPIALRLLGLAPDELRGGAEELLEMLNEAKIPVRVFDHTITEMMGVLDGVRSNLERARQQQLDLNAFTNLNREVIEHLMRERWGPGDVQEIMSSLEERLNNINVIVEAPPPITQQLSLAEGRFEEILREKGFTTSQIVMDIRSVTAIHRLRKGQVKNSLTKAAAIFVTPNPGLVRSTNRFFREQGLQGPIGPCIADISLTTQLWLVRSDGERKIPRKVLMAECYAALDPPQAVWRKYLEKIEARRAAGEVTDEQVKTLVFSSAAQESFFDITRNDESLVDDQTPQEVLSKYEITVREPAEIEAKRMGERLGEQQAENDELRREVQAGTAEREQQQDQLSAQQHRIDDLEGRQKASEERLRRRADRVRVGVAVAAALAIAAAGAVSLATGTISGALGFAAVVFLSTLLGLTALGWGLKKPLRWSWTAMVQIGAFLTLFFGVYGLAQAII